MDSLNDLRLGQAEKVVVPLQILRTILEPLSAKSSLVQIITLDHCAHRTVENDDAFTQQAFQFSRPIEFSAHVQLQCLPLLLMFQGPGPFGRGALPPSKDPYGQTLMLEMALRKLKINIS